MTQEELSDKSGVSVRTIQRIEAGKLPKGYTLRVLANALAIEANELIETPSEKLALQVPETIDKPQALVAVNYAALKLINLSTIPFIIFPPLNIIVPFLLVRLLKQKNIVSNQLISIQIFWTIISPVIFMLGIFLKLGNKFTLALMVLIVLSNLFIILSNAIGLDKNERLRITLNFSML